MKRLYLLIAAALLLLGVASSAGVWDIPSGTANAGVIISGTPAEEPSGPWTYVDYDYQTTGYSATASETVSVDVTAGDTIVVFGASWSSIGITGCSDNASGGTNTYVARDQLSSSSLRSRAYYCLSAKATETLTITVTRDAGSTTLSVIAIVARPGSGKSASFDVADVGTTGFEASPWETKSTCNTTGSDEFCVAAVWAYNTSATMSDPEIPSETDATVIYNSETEICSFYQILDTPTNSLAAEVDASAANAYSAEMLCFSAE
jgi:hypothetical protein